MHVAELTRHPASARSAVRSAEVRISFDDSGVLTLVYVLEGDMSLVRFPPARRPRTAFGLWRHTCFEAFAKIGHTAAYREFNFSPSTEWAVYSFSAYREGMTPVDEPLAAGVATRRLTKHFELEVAIRVERPLRLALAAVIEEHDGALSHWALSHPDGKPDFHHPGSYTLEA